MKSRFLALMLAAAGAAHGGDWEFDHVVRAIEDHYGVKQTHIPFMGVAKFFIKVAHPAGTSGFKLAIFEDLRAGDRDPLELDLFMNEVSGHGLHPLVVTHSRTDGESSYILAGAAGKSTKLLIATFDRNEATVVEVEANIDLLLRTIGSPGDGAKIFHNDRHERTDW